MHRLSICVILAAFCGLAQTRPAPRKAAPAPPPATRWPIARLAVEGNRHYEAAQILAVAGLKIGETAGRAEFEAARDRLVTAGVFESVGYRFEPDAEGKGYNASFQVVEIDTVYPVQLEDLGVPDTEILGLLRIRDPLFSPSGVAATKPVLDRYVQWVEQYLAGKGNHERIAARVAPNSAGVFTVLIRPARNRPAVAKISFEGDRVVPEGVLRTAISGVGIGSLYTEESFRQLLDTSVRPVYEARGRVRVAFPKIRTERDPEQEGLHVIVTVDEGESYTLGKVTIDGQPPLNPAQLLKAGDFKTGDMADFDRVNAGLERIRRMLRRNGYLNAKATTHRNIDDAKKAVDVGVAIDPGPLYTMGKLSIVGLDLEGEAEMSRIWTLKEGKPFDNEYPDYFLNRIREQGLFDDLGKTKSELHQDDGAHTVDVTLNFAGDNPGQGRPNHRRRP